ncbi:MAG: hypothetical protein ACK4F9_03845, partial [Brevinematia bacterium]
VAIMQKVLCVLVLTIAISNFECFSFNVYVKSLELTHYEYIEVNLEGIESVGSKDFYMYLLRDNGIIPDLLGREKIFGRFSNGRLVFLYIPNYGIRDGVYEMCILSNSNVLFRTNLVIMSRQQLKLNEPLKVLTFEENVPIQRLFSHRRKLSYREVANEIYEIMKDAGLNTFLMLAGQTTYLKSKEIWYSVPLSNLNVLKFLKDKGIQTGAYVMCFLTLGQNEKNRFNGYYPNLIMKNKDLVKDYKYTSILSDTRISNLIDVLEYIGKKDYVDFIGLDFIRTGDYGGYELIPDFASEILCKLDFTEKLDEKATLKSIKNNKEINKLFKWYKAIRVSRVVKEIVSSLRNRGINKPIIAFMLGWNAGREHGQDLFMFRDAGIDYSFYMLYEFYSDEMFDKAGEYYLKFVYNLDTQIVFGNIIDTKLNKGKNDPIKSFSERLKKFVTYYSYFPPNGFFFHDLYRLNFGRIKPYTKEEWMNQIRETTYFLSEFFRNN